MNQQHGTTRDDAPITDETVEALADEAERGYDVEDILRRRRGGHPAMGSAAATVESVRLDPEMKRALLLLRSCRRHERLGDHAPCGWRVPDGQTGRARRLAMSSRGAA